MGAGRGIRRRRRGRPRRWRAGGASPSRRARRAGGRGPSGRTRRRRRSPPARRRGSPGPGAAARARRATVRRGAGERHQRVAQQQRVDRARSAVSSPAMRDGARRGCLRCRGRCSPIVTAPSGLGGRSRRSAANPSPGSGSATSTGSVGEPGSSSVRPAPSSCGVPASCPGPSCPGFRSPRHGGAPGAAAPGRGGAGRPLAVPTGHATLRRAQRIRHYGRPPPRGTAVGSRPGRSVPYCS